MSGYDPLELTEKIKEKVVQGNQRKYYRFRKARFYGGIATGDCVGCNLSCYFCWSRKPRKQPGKVGRFYSPKEVVEKLKSIARENNLTQARLSGNEPTIGRTHLISVLKKLQDSNLSFILETNGILIGHDPSYASELARFENVHTRVSLKVSNREQFSRLTGAKPESFDLQIQALQNLVDAEASCHASLMRDFVDDEELSSLEERLEEIDPLLARQLEFENLILYPHVRKQLKEAGIPIPHK